MSASAHTLVVGGSKGIGRAVVGRLAGTGRAVSVIGRSLPTGLDDARSVKSWMADVADSAALDRTLSDIEAAQGPVSAVVLLQRYRGGGDQWAGELATSLTATRRLLEWSGDHLQDRGEGIALVIIGSVAGTFIAAEQPAGYHVAKAGMLQMMRYYAVAFGPKGFRVNSISPGTILKEESQAFYREHPELERLYCDIVPLGRMGTATDVAELTAFLLSKQASFLTGQNIILDGGLSLQWHEGLARRVARLGGLEVSRPPQEKS